MRTTNPASTEQITSLNPQPTLGALRGQAWLTVQTRQAQRLIQGRNGSEEKPAIIGLVGFADRLRLIWHAARSDDPYADWWLIKIDEAIEQARAFIRQSQSEIDEKLTTEKRRLRIDGCVFVDTHAAPDGHAQACTIAHRQGPCRIDQATLQV